MQKINQSQDTKLLELKDKILNIIANTVVITDINGNIQWANDAYTKLTGYSLEESVGINPRKLVNSNMENKKFFELLWSTILSGKVWHGEIKNRHKNGTIYDEEMTITPMMNDNNSIEFFIAVKQDITKRKKLEANIHKYAFYDNLTELPNRRLLADRFMTVQASSRRTNKYFAILFLDLDDFKPLNDTFGHSTGDLLLKEVALRLKKCVREIDTVSRFGGDEFVVLLQELGIDKDQSIEKTFSIAENIRKLLSKPYKLKLKKDKSYEFSIEHLCTTSIGALVLLNHECSFEEIIAKVDNAMYEAKKTGRNKIVMTN